ncbi:MAG: transporter substrate-binding domain-containing protein [Lachnospiraceae bacterium]
MKKRYWVIGMMTAALVALSACGKEAPEEKVEETMAEETEESAIDLSGVELMADGVLSVGCEVGYPPFEDFADDGTTPIGYDIDIITAVADKLGLEVNIINTAWDGIFTGIDVNYDCVCSAVTINAKRQETMLFSTPYINNYQAVVIPTGSELSITSFDDLDGKVIAVQKETTSDELMSDYKSTGTINTEIVANEKVTSCFTQLTNGEVDAVVVDSTVADGYIASSPELYTIAYKDMNEPEQFGIAMGLDNTALQAAINEALAQLEAEGYIEETYSYWFGAGEE